MVLDRTNKLVHIDWHFCVALSRISNIKSSSYSEDILSIPICTVQYRTVSGLRPISSDRNRLPVVVHNPARYGTSAY